MNWTYTGTDAKGQWSTGVGPLSLLVFVAEGFATAAKVSVDGTVYPVDCPSDNTEEVKRLTEKTVAKLLLNWLSVVTG